MSNDPPDETLLTDVLLTRRGQRAVNTANIKTVGDIRKMSDDDILRLPDAGKMTVLEFRLLTGQLKPGQHFKFQGDRVLKMKWLMAVAHGHCEHSFEEWKKEQLK